MNKQGYELMQRAAAIIAECSKLETPARAAHTAVFGMLVMLDGSGEAIGTQYKILTEDGKPVEFEHHELTEFAPYPEQNQETMSNQILIEVTKIDLTVPGDYIIYGEELDKYLFTMRTGMMGGWMRVTMDWNRSPWPNDKPLDSIIFRIHTLKI